MQVNLTINGQKITTTSDKTILVAAKGVGIDIPTLCYHPNLSAFGGCRLCVVEVEGRNKLPAACVTAVMDGMVVHTESAVVMEARKIILELLLARHPLDCLTCQQAGDCKLQEYAYKYRVGKSSLAGEKNYSKIDDSNPYILRDNNKCILCGCCVRACSEIKGKAILDFTSRGFATKVTTPLDQDLKDTKCKYCNNCVAACPVGALVDKRLLGKGRSWEFTSEEVDCGLCEKGCKFDLIKKNGEVVGVTARVGVAERKNMPCSKGRLATDFIHNPHIEERPLRERDGKFVPVSWDEALGLKDIFAKFRQIDARKNR